VEIATEAGDEQRLERGSMLRGEPMVDAIFWMAASSGYG
jgi:hypothetical protein